MAQDAPKAIVLLSGGVDSAVALAMCRERHPALRGTLAPPLFAMCVNYGQANWPMEKIASRALAEEYAAVWVSPDLTGLYDRYEPLLSGGLALNQDWDKAELAYRNGVLIGLAAAYILAQGGGELWTGIQPAAQPGLVSYADTTQRFLDAQQEACWQGSNHKVHLTSPFFSGGAFKDKDDIIREGHRLDVPWELTHSCFRNRHGGCGTCVTCGQRERAFKRVGLRDPAVEPHRR